MCCKDDISKLTQKDVGNEPSSLGDLLVQTGLIEPEDLVPWIVIKKYKED